MKLDRRQDALRSRDAAGGRDAPLRSAGEVREVAAHDLRGRDAGAARRARSASTGRALKRWLHIDTTPCPRRSAKQRERVLKASSRLATVYTMRDELAGAVAALDARRRNSSCTSSKTGAAAPKRAASRRCRTSRAGCAATPDRRQFARHKKARRCGLFVDQARSLDCARPPEWVRYPRLGVT